MLATVWQLDGVGILDAGAALGPVVTATWGREGYNDLCGNKQLDYILNCQFHSVVFHCLRPKKLLSITFFSFMKQINIVQLLCYSCCCLVHR